MPFHECSKKRKPSTIFLYFVFCFVETGFHVAQASLELLIRLHLGLDCRVTNVHWHLARNPSGLRPPLLPCCTVLLFAKLGTLGTDKRQLLTLQQQLQASRRQCLLLRSRPTQTGHTVGPKCLHSQKANHSSGLGVILGSRT